MKCPFKSRTVYEKSRTMAEGGRQWYPTNAKEAYRITYDFGECDEKDCPHYEDSKCGKEGTK